MTLDPASLSLDLDFTKMMRKGIFEYAKLLERDSLLSKIPRNQLVPKFRM